MKNLLSLFLAVVVMASFTSCSEDDDSTGVATSDLAGTLAANPDYSSLVEALELTGLTSTFTGSTRYTIFAPSNDAFQALLDSNAAWNTLEDIPTEDLTQVLLNHVVQGPVLSNNLTTGYINNLANYGEDADVKLSMHINTAEGVVINGGAANGGATVTNANTISTNGVIHQVDAVIGLPTVVNFAVADPNFSTLVSALTTATPGTDFVAALSGEGPFTVFAPTNEAFTALLATNPDWNALEDIGEATLTDVLNYHVASGNTRAEDLTNGAIVETLLTGNSFEIVIPGTDEAVAAINDGTDDDKNIIATNVQAINGVIHVPAGVLLP